MKIRVLCSLAVCLSMTVAAQVRRTRPSQAAIAGNQKTIEKQNTVDAVVAELNATQAKETDTSARLTALDQVKAKLKQSDQTQIDTSRMVQKQLDKLKYETLPAIQARADAWDVKRQNHIRSGCPAEGGAAPVAQANRCNAETASLMAERAQIFSDANAAMKQKAQYEQLRNAVSATTLSNAAEEKANNAQRDALNALKAQLDASKKQLEAKLENLKKGIDSCARLLAQRGVSCEKIKARCGNIQFDGADPDLPASVYDSPCQAPFARKRRTRGATANK